MMVGAVVLPPGLLWSAWTSSPHITWVLQALAGIPIGMGIQVIHTMGPNYMLDVYTPYAASAVSANAFIRSMAAAGFSRFATPLYDHMVSVGLGDVAVGVLVGAYYASTNIVLSLWGTAKEHGPL